MLFFFFPGICCHHIPPARMKLLVQLEQDTNFIFQTKGFWCSLGTRRQTFLQGHKINTPLGVEYLPIRLAWWKVLPNTSKEKCYSSFPDMLLDKGQLKAWIKTSYSRSWQRPHLVLVFFFISPHKTGLHTARSFYIEVSSQAFVLHALIHRYCQLCFAYKANQSKLGIA